jgi:hypothetical protein
VRKKTHAEPMPEEQRPASQPPSAASPEHMLSAREAALWLQVNPRTAQLRARRAPVAGDPAVRTIAGAYCAPDWWWQKVLAKPIKVGRPRKDES